MQVNEDAFIILEQTLRLHIVSVKGERPTNHQNGSNPGGLSVRFHMIRRQLLERVRDSSFLRQVGLKDSQLVELKALASHDIG